MKNRYKKNQLLIFASILIIIIVLLIIRLSFIIKINTYIKLPGIIVNKEEIEVVIKKEEISQLKNNTSVIIDNKTYSSKISKEIIELTNNYYQVTLSIENANYNLLETKEIIIYNGKISIIKMIMKGVGINEKIN